MDKARSSGGDTLLDWLAYAEGGPHTGQRLPREILAEIRRARAEIPWHPGVVDYRGGHMYAGVEDAAHLDYLRRRLRDHASRRDPAERRAVLAFLALQTREGTTAAINTYDDQVVTWGTGFGGRGYLGAVTARAAETEAIAKALEYAGLRFRPRGQYDVVDLAAERVVSGKTQALLAVRSSPPLLHLLVELARSPATRNAVTDAQLAVFLSGSGAVTGAETIATTALYNFVVHLRHWAPSYAAGCVEWAAARDPGPPSAERDARLAVLITRYFYGRARRASWIPAWSQLRIYFARHMREDGLDLSQDPFILAASPPEEDPFEDEPEEPIRPKTPPQDSAPRTLQSPMLRASLVLSSIATGGTTPLRTGTHGGAVTTLQRALQSCGVTFPGGADGHFGPATERAVQSFQRRAGLVADGIAGRDTLFALDAALMSKTK